MDRILKRIHILNCILWGCVLAWLLSSLNFQTLEISLPVPQLSFWLAAAVSFLMLGHCLDELLRKKEDSCEDKDNEIQE